MKIEEILFSAVPGRMDPQLLLVAYQERLLNGIKVYLNKLAETIYLDLSAHVEKVSRLNPKRRFSPVLHAIYAKLSFHYENKDLESLFHYVQFFINETDATIYADDISFSSLLAESWEISILEELRASMPQDSSKKQDMLLPLIHWDKSAFPPIEVQEALKLLKDLDADLYEEYAVYVSRIKMFSSKLLVACTSPKFFGAIYLRPALSSEESLIYYLDCLAHEVSHLHLYTLMGEDPMILNQKNELFFSPLRPDKRPMYGIFHAAFVLSRMVRVLRKYKKSMSGVVDEWLQKKEAHFRSACSIIADNAILTKAGRELFNTLELCAFEN